MVLHYWNAVSFGVEGLKSCTIVLHAVVGMWNSS